jgi:IPT/TIG domain
MMRLLAVPFALSFLCAAVAAQGAAGSQNYFMSSVEFAAGNEGTSSLYQAQSISPSSLSIEPGASSAACVSSGGFLGALQVPLVGVPWVTGVTPRFVKPSGSPTILLHGSQLAAGSQPVVEIGGAVATVVSRAGDQLSATAPPLPVPGYQSVSLTTSTGSSRLESGIGVLPMIDTPEPLNGWDPNALRFHVSQGDFLIFGLASRLSPVGIQFEDWKHLLLLDPADIVLTDSYFVADPEGKLTLTIPPFFASGQVHCQALVITNEPSYAPASFTNVLSL